MKLKRAAYRHIEAEIYCYNDTLKAIDELKRNIYYAGRNLRYSDLIRTPGYKGTSVVERKATWLADSILLREMERITDAIRETYAKTKNETRQVIWLKYGLTLDWEPPAGLKQLVDMQDRNGMSVSQMSSILSIDDSTFHRYRTGYVLSVAKKLGWW